MRRILFCFILFVLSACKHEPEFVDQTPFLPILVFNSDQGALYSDTTLGVNEDFYVDLSADYNPETNKILTRFCIVKQYLGTEVVVFDSSFLQPSFRFKGLLNSGSQIGTSKWIFRVYDQKFRMQEKSFIINTQASAIDISFIQGASYTSASAYLEIGSLFKIGINAQASAGKQLTQITVTRKGSLGSTVILDSAFLSQSITYSNTYQALPDDDNEKWIFTVKDSEGKVGSVSLYISTFTLLKYEYHAVINNPMSGLYYSWNLIDNAPVEAFGANSDKDISSNTIPPGTAPYYFSSGIKSLNNTAFFGTWYVDYEFPIQSDMVDAYSGATPNQISTEVMNLQKGEVYISKLRNSNFYVIFKVDEVINTTDDNNDKILISYKKSQP